jgi:hypothetical protein
MAMLDEVGKWDLQIKDPENADVEYMKTEKIQEYMRDAYKGKISKVGNIKIERYVVDHDILRAQPYKIGNVVMKYYTSSHNAAAYGKVMRVGSLLLEYHSYQTQKSYGKIKKIGNIRVDYYSKEGHKLEGKLDKIGGLKAIYNDAGEIVELKGSQGGLEIEFWSKDKMTQMEKQATSEDELEKELDKVLDGK